MPLPDAERLAVAYLKGVPEVIAAVGDHVGAALPTGEEPVWPWVTVVRAGGLPPIPGFLDEARLDVAAWASTKGIARVIAATCEEAFLDMVGAHPLGVVSKVVESGEGLRWAPDDATDTPRYEFTVTLYTHPGA